jgi:exonuclease III
VGGVRKKGLASFARDMLREMNFDLVCFQETMMQDLSNANLRSIDPNKIYLWDWNLAKDRYGGILMGIKIDRFHVGSRTQGKFILQHNLWDKMLEIMWNILNVYEPTHDDGNEAFLSELASFCSKNKETYIVWGGGVNIISFLIRTRIFILVGFLIFSTPLFIFKV